METKILNNRFDAEDSAEARASTAQYVATATNDKMPEAFRMYAEAFGETAYQEHPYHVMRLNDILLLPGAEVKALRTGRNKRERLVDYVWDEWAWEADGGYTG